MNPIISARGLSKDYRIPISKIGLGRSILSLFHRKYEIRRAVNDISFDIHKGEMVGYIGPNGAGKSTTIKMLSGVLTPSSGYVEADGIQPYKNRLENAKKIGVVFGQRSQLYWDLPILDTFTLYKRLYNIPEKVFQKNYAMLIELLSLAEILHQPARQLSLGQKMKANLALAMLHNPAILYLDEPTIGLDVTSRRALREGIKVVNKENHTTVILTTHDMADIEAVCKRLLLIDKGTLLFDGDLEAFKSTYEEDTRIGLAFVNLPDWIDDERFELNITNDGQWLVKAKNQMPLTDAMLILLDRYKPDHVTIKESSIEDIVVRLFGKDR